MTFRLVEDALRAPIRAASAKVLLIALAERANDEGECWPSIRALIAATGMSESQILRRQKLLAAAGWIAVSRRFAEDGRQRSNGYLLNVEKMKGEGVIHEGGRVSHMEGGRVSSDDTPKNPQKEPPLEPEDRFPTENAREACAAPLEDAARPPRPAPNAEWVPIRRLGAKPGVEVPFTDEDYDWEFGWRVPDPEPPRDPAPPRAPIEPTMDDRAMIFAVGLPWMAGVVGKPPEKMRPLVGRWLKQAGDKALAAIFEAAMAEGVADPPAWIIAAIAARSKTNGAGKRSIFADFAS